MPDFVAIEKPQGLGDLTDAVNNRLAELYDSFEANKIGIVIPGAQTQSGESVRLTVQEVLVPLYGSAATETLIDAESILGGTKWTDLTDGGDTVLHKHDIYAALAETETITAQWLFDGSTKLTFGAATEFIHRSATGKLSMGAATEVIASQTFRISGGGADDYLYFGAASNAYFRAYSDGRFDVLGASRVSLYGGGAEVFRATATEAECYKQLDMNGQNIVGSRAIQVHGPTGVAISFWQGVIGALNAGAYIYAEYTFDEFLLLLTARTGTQLIVGHLNWASKDFDHADQANPTLFIHSATNPDDDNTQWWSIAHDQTDAIYNVGTGLHKFTTGNIRLDSTLAVEFNAATEYWNSGAAGYIDCHWADDDKGQRGYSGANPMYEWSRLSAALATRSMLTVPVALNLNISPGAGSGSYTVQVDTAQVIYVTASQYTVYGNLRMRTDNKWIGLGSGTSVFLPDAKIYYDAANLIIDPDAIGTGEVYIGATGEDTIQAGIYKVAGNQVVAAQGAAVADATGAGDVVAQLNALLARCRAHGLIAT